MATNEQLHGTRASRYLDYLPAIFQQDAQVDQPNFLGRFLLAFEQVLTGLGDIDEPGLEEILDGIPGGTPGTFRLRGVERYFDPGPYPAERAGEQAPQEFLGWLAGWVGLALRGDLDELRQRDFIARAISLYRLRGTRQGLAEFVSIYTRLGSTIEELDTPFQIGLHSRIGVDTWLAGGPAHFFRVTIRLSTTNVEQIGKHRQVATAILDMEKPAHTYYQLIVETPKMQIGVRSRIGVDTLLDPTPDT